ncbi:MAG TPA: endonuclease domain-containing protein [Sphingomicrobium sp.]|nr:endonuclease domain-containing protein [Sphingomicrobium sp.]
MTLPEGLLWRVLSERPDGLKFRRQHPIGRCIVDFYCPRRRVVIEVDGMSHAMGEHPQRDIRRDEWLSGQDLRILRFAAADVMKDLESMVTAILLACRR